MNRLLLLCLIGILPFASTVAVSQQPSEKAVLYYEGWDTLTRAQLSPDDVRRTAPVVVTLRDRQHIDIVLRWLNLGALKQHNSRPEDARLVVDFFDAGEKRESYYVSRFNLLSEDSKRARPIDEKFRRHFRFLEEQ